MYHRSWKCQRAALQYCAKRLTLQEDIEGATDMPSIVHETPMELIRQYPPLVLDLVRAVSDLKLGGGTRVRLVPADASVVVPAQYLADGVALAEDEYGNPLLAVIIEPQGRDANTKEYSWPVYVCSIRKQQKCDVLLLVVCWNPDEVEECRQTIRTGHPGFDLRPIVAHPGNTLSSDSGERGPYLILFAGYIGAIDLDSDDGQRLVLEAARHAMEAKMATPAYRSDFIDSFKAEGRAEGKAESLALAIMKTLAVRGILVDEKRTEQVQSCADLDQLNTWFESALTAETADDIFDS
jgi:hypothetical protein